MEDKDLLDIAKGVTKLTEQPTNIKQYWKFVPENRREQERKRKLARRHLHKAVKYIKMGKPLPESMEDAHAVKELISVHLRPNFGINWDTFSWKWDLHPADHTKIVLKENWIKEGGGFDPDFGQRAPTAFTKDGSDIS